MYSEQYTAKGPEPCRKTDFKNCVVLKAFICIHASCQLCKKQFIPTEMSVFDHWETTSFKYFNLGIFKYIFKVYFRSSGVQF